MLIAVIHPVYLKKLFWYGSTAMNGPVIIAEVLLAGTSGHAVLEVYSVHCRWQQPSWRTQGDISVFVNFFVQMSFHPIFHFFSLPVPQICFFISCFISFILTLVENVLSQEVCHCNFLFLTHLIWFLSPSCNYFLLRLLFCYGYACLRDSNIRKLTYGYIGLQCVWSCSYTLIVISYY